MAQEERFLNFNQSKKLEDIINNQSQAVCGEDFGSQQLHILLLY